MVHKQVRWNISKAMGEEYAHKYIIEILHDSKESKISLSELIILLNQRTKHIKFTINKTKKPFSVYLRTIYGSIHKFMENYSFYKVTNIDAEINIQLVDKELTHTNLTTDIINEYREWTLIDTDDFEFI